MTVLGGGRRVHQVTRLELEDLREFSDGRQAGGGAALEAGNRGDIDADELRELALGQRPPRSPVGQSRRGDQGRARCHRPTGDGSDIGSCDSHGVHCTWASVGHS